MEKHSKLLSRLLEQTTAGVLIWQSTAKINAFQVSFVTSSVRIRQENGEYTIDYYLDLIDANGDVVESFSDEEIDEKLNTLTPDRKHFKMMQSLHELARRSALGADKVLDDILKELDSLNDLPI